MSARHRLPNDNQELRSFIQDFINALREQGRDNKDLTDGADELEKLLNDFVKYEQESERLQALRKEANARKYEVKQDIATTAAGIISYLEYKFGKTSEQLDKFNIKPRNL